MEIRRKEIVRDLVVDYQYFQSVSRVSILPIKLLTMATTLRNETKTWQRIM